jgi:hypothetical protein
VLRGLLHVLRQADKRHIILLANLQTGQDGCIAAIRANIASPHRLKIYSPKVDWSNPHPHRTSTSHRLLVISAVIFDHIITTVQHAHALAQQVTVTDLLDLDRDKSVGVWPQAVGASQEGPQLLRWLLRPDQNTATEEISAMTTEQFIQLLRLGILAYLVTREAAGMNPAATFQTRPTLLDHYVSLYSMCHDYTEEYVAIPLLGLDLFCTFA